MTAFTGVQPKTCSRVSQLSGSPLRQQQRASFSASRKSFAVRASGNGSRVDKFDKHSIIVSPSILSADFAKLGEQVLLLTQRLSTSFLTAVTRELINSLVTCTSLTVASCD